MPKGIISVRKELNSEKFISDDGSGDGYERAAYFTIIFPQKSSDCLININLLIHTLAPG